MREKMFFYTKDKSLKCNKITPPFQLLSFCALKAKLLQPKL